MKLILLAVCFALAAAYDDLDDNYYGKILDNRKDLEAFLKCLVDQAPCNSEFATRAKSHMAEFFKDGCNECDERQKHYSHLMILIVKSDYPDIYKALEAKYDPKGNVFNIERKLNNL